MKDTVTARLPRGACLERQDPVLIEYADGSLIDWEVNNLYAPTPSRGTMFYTSEGYLKNRGGWEAFKGTITPRNRPHPGGMDEYNMNRSFPNAKYTPGPKIDASTEKDVSHFENFIHAVRSRKIEDLNCDILDGHLSTSLAQLSTISYRLGRKLVFDPDTETFPGDQEANSYLTRTYREPFVLPDKV